MEAKDGAPEDATGTGGIHTRTEELRGLGLQLKHKMKQPQDLNWGSNMAVQTALIHNHCKCHFLLNFMYATSQGHC